MDDKIVCPKCKTPIPLTQAIKNQMEEEISRKFKKENEQLKEQLKNKDTEVEAQKKAMWQKALAIAEERMKEKSGEELKFLKEQVETQNKKLDDARKAELELRKEKLALEEKEKELELKVQRTLDEERKKLTEDAYKKAVEDNRLRDLEKEKQIQDLRKALEDAQRKAAQGSQQLQGEVLELELESILKAEFPFDEILPVAKGMRGGDVIHVVKNNYGKPCGTIIWESKRTKAWSDGWIVKLKEDQRQAKAELAIIITNVLPAGIKLFGLKDGVWITHFDSLTALAMTLRMNLIELAALRLASIGKQEKKEILWNYLTSVEFRQRVEAVYDAYSQMMVDLKKEKDWFTKKWAKQEKNIQKVADNILGMHGDLEGIVGKSLPEIQGLEVLPAGKVKSEEEGLF